MKCKWYADFEGVCTNGECPYRGDVCPTCEYPEVCKYCNKPVKKLSVGDIVEGLRICSGGDSCHGCPAQNLSVDCSKALKEQAADMLKKLAAEKDAKKAMSEAKNQRLIDVDALLEAMPKDGVLLSCDVRKAILDAPIVDAVPLDFHNLCLEIGRAEIEKLIALVKKNEWISVEDGPPKNEQEVLIYCNRDGFKFVCPAIYEDGTMLTQNSCWNWYDIEEYGTYSEENDDYFVPKGWWENRQFTPDDVYNCPVDCEVTHWKALPKPPKEEER